MKNTNNLYPQIRITEQTMSTANFCYDNRCVVVTNDDYECGNYPRLDRYRHESIWAYPSWIVTGYDFRLWDIVFTAGYYEHACIDYVEKPNARNKYNYFNVVRYSRVREFCEDVYQEFGKIVSRTRIRKIFSGFRRSGKEIYDFLEDKCEELVEYAATIERKAVDAAIDKIKTEYGYAEYGVCAKFSNGETGYAKIA